MLRRFSDAASLLARQAAPDSSTPASLSPHREHLEVPSGSPALDEALSSDMIPPVKPDFTEQGQSDLRAALRDLQDAPVNDLGRRLEAVATVQLVLQEYDSNHMRAAFTADGGYEIAIGALAALGQCEDSEGRFAMATLLFKVLHLGSSPDSCHLDQVSDSLASAFELARLAAADSPPADKLRAISLLVAFATGDFANGGQQTDSLLKRAVEATASLAEPTDKLEKVLHLVAESDPDLESPRQQMTVGIPLLVETIDRLLAAEEDELLRLVALAAVFRLDRAADPHDDTSVVQLEAAGVFNMALQRLLPRLGGGQPRRLAEPERLLWREVAGASLDRLGASGKNALRLFDGMVTDTGIDTVAAELVLEGMRAAGDPAVVSFDASRGRSCRLRLPSVGKPFPPAAHGYTFMAWISITEPPTPASSPLLIFTAADPSLRTYVEFSVTPDRRFAVQTSLKIPPAVFEDFALVPGQLYHLAVVHERPRFSAAAPISLYINGQSAGSLRVNYPAAPPSDWVVEARFGTPQERVRPASQTATTEARGPRWHLGPSWLVYGNLSADFVQAAHLLGPRYSGNFQDRLSRFLTASAASATHLEADAQQPSGPVKSPLASTLEQRGSRVLPQSRIYFALSAANVLESPSPLRISSPDERLAIENALLRGPALLNTAKTESLAAVVDCPDGLAVAENCSLLRTQGLDDKLWVAGGTALLLRWVEAAATTEQLELVVGIFAEALADSWRLCAEAGESDWPAQDIHREETDKTRMDADHASTYDILAMLLQRRSDLLTPALHLSLLRLAGVDGSQPENSVLSSLPANDNLVCNFRLWSAASPEVQRQHIEVMARLVGADASAANIKKLRKLSTY